MKGGELECTAVFCCYCCCLEWSNFRRWWGIEFRQQQVPMIAQEEEFSRQWQLLGGFSFLKLISQLSHRHQHWEKLKNWLLFYIIIEPTNKRQFSWMCWIVETRVSCLQRSCIIFTMLEKCEIIEKCKNSPSRQPLASKTMIADSWKLRQFSLISMSFS